MEFAIAAETCIEELELPAQSFQALRRRAREALMAAGIADKLDALVERLLFG